jgi:peptidoglycan hydrolase CwlO-like protein
MNILRFLVLVLAPLFILVPTIWAQSTDEINKSIEALRQKIIQLQGEEKSLSNQISLLNSQISLSEAKIRVTEGGIAKLEGEIGELDVEIEKLEELKTQRLELVLHRIPESYKRSRGSAFGAIFLSRNFSDFLTRIKYLARVQAEDSRYYQELQLTQDSYNERRDQREKKKEQQETLRQQLQAEVRQRDRQRQEKEVLLTQTRNSETVYQQLLAQALAEKNALERALVEAVQVGPVKKGDPIALVGNTGSPACSSGPHLHFEIRKGGSWVDPGGFLVSKAVYDEQSKSNATIGSGSWDWPLQDTIRVTQRFGHTPWSWQYSYSGGIHTGIDMVSSSSTVIRAPADGTLYSSSQSCGSSSIIKIKYIDHGDGALSFYLHVQ